MKYNFNVSHVFIVLIFTLETFLKFHILRIDNLIAVKLPIHSNEHS